MTTTLLALDEQLDHDFPLVFMNNDRSDGSTARVRRYRNHDYRPNVVDIR
jgi:hypothetical protein